MLALLSAFSRETGSMYTHIKVRGDLLQELAHAVMEAEKSHNLLSANWRHRKAKGVLQSESKA